MKREVEVCVCRFYNMQSTKPRQSIHKYVYVCSCILTAFCPLNPVKLYYNYTYMHINVCICMYT